MASPRRTRRPTVAALALLLMIAIVLVAGIAADDNDPQKPKRGKKDNKNKGEGGDEPTSSLSSTLLSCPTDCANGAKCVRGRCKCHPGSTGEKCATLLPGYYFDATKSRKSKKCPGE